MSYVVPELHEIRQSPDHEALNCESVGLVA